MKLSNPDSKILNLPKQLTLHSGQPSSFQKKKKKKNESKSDDTNLWLTKTMWRVQTGRIKLTNIQWKHLDNFRPKFYHGIKCFICEFIGTGIFLFVALMTVSSFLYYQGSHEGLMGEFFGLVLTFCMALAIPIQIFMNQTGGHMNPAVTVLIWFFDGISIPLAFVYIIAQCLGSFVGYAIMIRLASSLFEDKNYLKEFGVTKVHKNISAAQGFVTEFLLSAVLMLIVACIVDPKNNNSTEAFTLKVGFFVFTLAVAGFPHTGASLNPARSFGPALYYNSWSDHWVYWVGPILASLVVGFFYVTFLSGPLKKTEEKLTEEGVAIE